MPDHGTAPQKSDKRAAESKHKPEGASPEDIEAPFDDAHIIRHICAERQHHKTRHLEALSSERYSDDCATQNQTCHRPSERKFKAAEDEPQYIDYEGSRTHPSFTAPTRRMPVPVIPILSVYHIIAVIATVN